MATGAGLYFDGTSSTRHAVTIEAAPAALRIMDAGGSLIGEWPYAELRAQSAPDAVMPARRT